MLTGCKGCFFSDLINQDIRSLILIQSFSISMATNTTADRAMVSANSYRVSGTVLKTGFKNGIYTVVSCKTKVNSTHPAVVCC